MSIGQDTLIAILNNENFVESVSVIPAANPQLESDRVTLNARIARQQPSPVQRDKEGSFIDYTAEIKILATVHATHGGMVAPAIGDKWKIAKARGGTAVDGWKLTSIQPGDGKWILTVTLRDYLEKGGRRQGVA